MGCGSSREVSSQTRNRNSSPPTAQARLGTPHAANSPSPVAQTPLTQSTNNVQSATTSRAALNPVSQTSLPPPSVVSSSRHSTNRHRHRGTTEATSSNLSEHYNVPLRPPKPWKSTSRSWSPSQLSRERHDFFDTRVGGQSGVWEALRQVSECVREGDIATAQGILDAVSVTLPTGHIEEGCYDDRGNLYKMPEEILTDPVNLQSDDGEVDGETVVEIPAETKAKLAGEVSEKSVSSLPKTGLEEKLEVAVIDKGKETIPEDAIQLKCRLSDRGTDVVLHIGRSQRLGVLAVRIKEAAQTPAYARIELFYLGRKLDQKKPLEEQEYREGHVLNVFVVGAPK